MQADSPGINAGRGLKLTVRSLSMSLVRDSPGINAGRGLKHMGYPFVIINVEIRPALMPGVD